MELMELVTANVPCSRRTDIMIEYTLDQEPVYGTYVCVTVTHPYLRGVRTPTAPDGITVITDPGNRQGQDQQGPSPTGISCQALTPFVSLAPFETIDNN